MCGTYKNDPPIVVHRYLARELERVSNYHLIFTSSLFSSSLSSSLANGPAFREGGSGKETDGTDGGRGGGREGEEGEVKRVAQLCIHHTNRTKDSLHCCTVEAGHHLPAL